MKFLVDFAALRSALNLCATVVEKKPNTVIAILKDVRISAAGDTLTLAATDLEVTAICTIPAVVAEPGACTIEMAAMIDIAKSARDSVFFALNTENMHVAIASGTAKYELPAMSADDYPMLPEMDQSDEMQFSASEFLPMLRTVSYAISKSDELQMTLRGVQVKATERAIEICAINVFQLSIVTLPGKFKTEAAIFLPAKLVRAADKLTVSADATNVAVTWNRSHAALTLGSVTLIGRLEDWRFPEYGSFIRKPSARVARVETACALDSVRRVAPFASNRTNAIIIEATHDAITVRSAANNARGRSSDVIPIVSYDGDAVRIGMSAVHMTDALATIATVATDIDFGDGKDGIHLRPVDSSLPFSALHIAMPIDLSKIEGGA